MKKMILTFFALLVLFTSNAQVSNFEKELSQVFSMLDTATDKLAIKVASEEFARIAKQNPTQWLAQYYGAYAKCIHSFKEENTENKDLLIDEAEAFFNLINTMKIESEHTRILQAFIAYFRLNVAPQKRFAKYGKVFSEHLEKAKGLNPNNPQAYYLKGDAVLTLPQTFGNSASQQAS